MTFDPGHFHAALIHKEMVPGVSPRAFVYAPLGPDLVAHLGRIAAFNTRPVNPTRWRLEVHADDDCLERMLRHQPGNVVVLSGRNRPKIEVMLAAVEAGLHVLADKPWVVDSADLPKLERLFEAAALRELLVHDMMTERYEVTSQLQRELAHDAEVFGEPLDGTPDEPAVEMESVHYLRKQVAGAPLRRPPWFFDTRTTGEGLSDVGTHLVDLVNWFFFTRDPLDHRQDVRIYEATHWPTPISRDDFRSMTGEADFPVALGPVSGGRLSFFCNNQVGYALRGRHVRLTVRWDLEAASGGGDTHFARLRGSRSALVIRHDPPLVGRPELFVVPNDPAERETVATALGRRLPDLHARFPGIAVAERGAEVQLVVPDALRVGHELHFAQVLAQFLKYLASPRSLPAWEQPNLIAKYQVTCKGVDFARRPPPPGPPVAVSPPA